MVEDEKTIFCYEGVLYDCSGYVRKHPGGRQIIADMTTEKKDFTEYFKTLHSE
jgi:cytochrome b involved in lipid metabolism